MTSNQRTMASNQVQDYRVHGEGVVAWDIYIYIYKTVYIPPSKLTPFEYVFPSKNGDIPLQRVYMYIYIYHISATTRNSL